MGSDEFLKCVHYTRFSDYHETGEPEYGCDVWGDIPPPSHCDQGRCKTCDYFETWEDYAPYPWGFATSDGFEYMVYKNPPTVEDDYTYVLRLANGLDLKEQMNRFRGWWALGEDGNEELDVDEEREC